MSGAINWSSDVEFTVDGVSYACHTEEGPRPAADMVVFKTRRYIDTYEALIEDLQPRNIFELGIFAGGSTALFAQLAKPEKLVAVDRRGTSAPALEQFIDAHDLRRRVITEY